MPAPSFLFKQFEVRHDRCAHRVGTDGVLLGAWADGGKHLLDIGTGSGLIALMMAQRYSHALVDAIEPDEPSAAQARENFKGNLFADRIRLFGKRLQDFFPTVQYDSIVCNPPFYVNGLLGGDHRRMQARHSQWLPLGELMEGVDRLLTKEGAFSLILPTTSVPALVSEALSRGFSVQKRTDVATIEGKSPTRTLLKLTRNSDKMLLEEQFISHKDGTKSEWHHALTRDFYL